MTLGLRECDGSVAALLRRREIRCSMSSIQARWRSIQQRVGSGILRFRALLFFCSASTRCAPSPSVRMYEAPEGRDDGRLRAADVGQLLVVLPAATQAAVERDELVIDRRLGLDVLGLDVIPRALCLDDIE